MLAMRVPGVVMSETGHQVCASQSAQPGFQSMELQVCCEAFLIAVDAEALDLAVHRFPGSPECESRAPSSP